MQAVTLTINRQEVSGPPGMTILELARESGIDIPTLCHHASLNPMGACRICLVENEANGALLASCVTAIAPGMSILTDSPRVLEHRRMILQLMLASHPDSCLVCDKGNRCELRQLASEMGIGFIELDRIPQAAVTEEANPFLARDLSKCILCGRCIRACQELVVEGALDYYGRGFGTRPETLFQGPLESSECTFCGTCVALCPTGALMEIEPLYRGSTGTAVESTCPHCSCGCSITLEVKDDRLARVSPSKKEPGPETLCVRGSYGCDFIHSEERLTRPLVKKDGRFRECSWEEALGAAAAALNKIKAEHDPESLAFFGSANCTNEENYLFQRFARTVLGTNNLDNGSSLYHAAARRGFHEAIGLPGINYPLKDLACTDLFLVVGADPASTAPLLSYEIKRAVTQRGARLILIDPRKSKLAGYAHCRLRPAAGTDLALLKGIAAVIVDEELTDREFIARKTENYADLLQSLQGFSLEDAAGCTGISAEEIARAARLYARADKGAIIFGSGVIQQPCGVENVKALLNLALLTGHIWRKGGGVRALLRECNAQGACDMGALPDYLPGHQLLKDPSARKKFEKHWQVELSSKRGWGALEMMEQAATGGLKGIYIAGENPAALFPGSSPVREALDRLELVVVQDLFMTETASRADIIFPAASFAEKEGSFTNLEGKMRKIRKAVSPPGESRPDWRIILDLAAAMGQPLPFNTLEEVQDELEELITFCRYDWEEAGLEEEPFWETRADSRLPLKRFPRFSPVEYALPEAAEQGKFVLLAESGLFHSGSGSRSARSGRLSRFSSAVPVKMNRADAEKLKLGAGDRVEVASAVGRMEAVVECSDELPEGIVTLPRSRCDRSVNALFSSLPENPALSSGLQRCDVRIERSKSDGPGA